MEYIVEVIMFLLSIIITILGFFVKRFINKVDILEIELAKHKESDIGKYATKEELRIQSTDFQDFLRELISPVNRKLESIETHLRKKM